MYLELIRFRKDGHGGSTGMHTTLRLGGRHTLYTMHTTFVLERTIYICTAHGEVDLLVTTHSTLADTGYRKVPTFGVAEALVHLEQVAGKQTGFVATCSSTDFHLYILCVLRILGNQRQFDFLFQLGLQILIQRQLLTSHLLHLGIVLVGQDVLGFLDGIQTSDVTFADIHNVTKVLIFLC